MAQEDNSSRQPDPVQYEFLARRAGLDRAWELFPQDVIDAIEAAVQLSRSIPRPSGPQDDIWPPMGVERQA